MNGWVALVTGKKIRRKAVGGSSVEVKNSPSEFDEAVLWPSIFPKFEVNAPMPERVRKSSGDRAARTRRFAEIRAGAVSNPDAMKDA